MAKMDFRNQSVNAHDFAMVPRADIPRSSFRRQSSHKTTFDAGNLYPVFVDEVLPGDTFNFKMTAFCRMSTPIFPIMDNLYLESFFFFVPARLVWVNWQRFMGEQPNGPSQSIDFTLPVCNSPEGGYPIGTLQDYMGLGTAGQVAPTSVVTAQNLPVRCYNLIWNEWFRDENLQNAAVVDLDDGPDTYSDYVLLRRGKRHDYFTGCLPWAEKGGNPVVIPLGSMAPVKTTSGPDVFGGVGIAEPGIRFRGSTAGASPPFGVHPIAMGFVNSGDFTDVGTVTTAGAGGDLVYPTNLFADLSEATAATINQLRQSFQIQKLLERDARGGTRYTELLRSHFGVVSPDARLQRPEFLGGGSSPVQVGSVPQTSASGLTGGTTPQGSLSAFGTIVHRDNGFTQSFVEHGYILGLISVRADLSYSQGVRRMWNRSTRYDFYFPVFAMLGEQAVLNQEIFIAGDARDQAVFGYQERWAEYRYMPSMITSLFRPSATDNLAEWHLSQFFATEPTLNTIFIQDTPPISRVIAAGDDGDGQQFIGDFFFDIKCARPMPMYSVPGLIDHF